MERILTRLAYRILTPSGEVREGVEHLVGVSALRARLEHQGHCVLWIRNASPWHRVISAVEAWTDRVSDRDLQLFSKEMAVLLRAGLPLAAGLRHLTAHTRSGRLRKLIDRVATDVESGMSFSDALKESGVFPRMYVAAVRSGESSDTLEPVLLRLHDHFHLVGQIRQKVRGALIYPLFLLFVTFAAVFYLLTVVVPVFEKLYLEVGRGLPWMTQWLLDLSLFIRTGWSMAVLVLVAGGLSWRVWGRQGWMKSVADRIWLKVPAIGRILREYSLSQFMRTFAMLIKSGVAVPSALRTAVAVMPMVPLRNAFERVAPEVESGSSLAGVLARFTDLPPLAVQMVHTGEQTGALEELCQSVAEIVEEELQSHLNVLLALLEPILMSVLGTIIALVLLAMYLPIFELSARVGG